MRPGVGEGEKKGGQKKGGGGGPGRGWWGEKGGPRDTMLEEGGKAPGLFGSGVAFPFGFRFTVRVARDRCPKGTWGGGGGAGEGGAEGPGRTQGGPQGGKGIREGPANWNVKTRLGPLGFLGRPNSTGVLKSIRAGTNRRAVPEKKRSVPLGRRGGVGKSRF